MNNFELNVQKIRKLDEIKKKYNFIQKNFVFQLLKI